LFIRKGKNYILPFHFIVGPIIWADRNSMLFPNILYMQIYKYYSKKLSLFFVFSVNINY